MSKIVYQNSAKGCIPRYLLFMLFINSQIQIWSQKSSFSHQVYLVYIRVCIMENSQNRIFLRSWLCQNRRIVRSLFYPLWKGLLLFNFLNL